MSERRVNDETFNAVCDFAQREFAKGEATTMQMIAIDLRDSLAREVAARATLATTQAALKDARAEIAAAERRGMEVAALFLERDAAEYTKQGDDDRFRGRRSDAYGNAALLQMEARALRAALPPPSDAASAASEVAS